VLVGFDLTLTLSLRGEGLGAKIWEGRTDRDIMQMKSGPATVVSKIATAFGLAMTDWPGFGAGEDPHCGRD
jgi:hypothetical protein